ncbi:MAG: 4-(cytidine 5'-diphospho)-2-C-methyl-D-erythritol kinase, partial [Candidatus Omnitrophica bacterium]|nr:4-(cytidine 5'-diphospho)-2-C-methyl-D-erythritol kinase [Candidatus Omnitrophota bacterium]
QRRPDGYHNLVSLVDPISLFDLIDFSPASTWQVKFKPWSGLDPTNNTVVKTVSLFTAHFSRTPSLQITVHKRIPIGAGLGGGSSDAACVLNILNKTSGANFCPEYLVKLAQQVGADVPVFITPRRYIVGGKGERLKPVAENFSLWYVLVCPPRPVSTARVFTCYDRLKKRGDLTWARSQIKILLENLQKGKVEEARNFMFNRLQEASEKEYPEIRQVRAYWENKCGQKFIISGSGSTLFSIFPDRSSAEKCATLSPNGKWQTKVISTFINSAERRGNGDN